jgi:hypothetical protein
MHICWLLLQLEQPLQLNVGRAHAPSSDGWPSLLMPPLPTLLLAAQCCAVAAAAVGAAVYNHWPTMPTTTGLKGSSWSTLMKR